jgi:SPP1 family predicted phage head-tail adaptor
MQAGSLNLILNVEVAAEYRTSTGAVSTEWSPLFTLRAATESQAGREFAAAKAINAEITEVFRCRWHPGITSKMRVKHGDRTLDITAVINVENRSREMLLHCVEGSRKGSA